MTVVYWLHNKECCGHHEGYIGISKRPDIRFKEHIASKRFPSDMSMTILFEGTEQECIDLEISLRPATFQGWNIMHGGGMPPAYVPKPPTEKQLLARSHNGKRNKGRIPNEKARQKMSLKSRGRKQSQETIDKRLASRVYSVSEEMKDKLRLHNLGKTDTAEVKAKKSLAAKAAWARRK